MDNLPTWAVTIAAVGVGLVPGLSILSTRPIDRLLHRLSSPHPKMAPKPRLEPAIGNWPAWQPGEDDGQADDFALSLISDRGPGQPMFGIPDGSLTTPEYPVDHARSSIRADGIVVRREGSHWAQPRPRFRHR